MVFECQVTPELQQKLIRVSSVLTQRYGRKCSFAEALDAMAEITLHRIDPARKAQRSAARKAVPKPEKAELPKLDIPSQLKLAALRRDVGQCTHRDSRRVRCGRRKRLEAVPVADGKPLSVNNLTTLCATHYRARLTASSVRP